MGMVWSPRKGNAPGVGQGLKIFDVVKSGGKRRDICHCDGRFVYSRETQFYKVAKFRATARVNDFLYHMCPIQLVSFQYEFHKFFLRFC